MNIENLRPKPNSFSTPADDLFLNPGFYCELYDKIEDGLSSNFFIFTR